MTNKQVDLTEVADPNYELNFQKSDFQSGYEFSFDWDTNDALSGADVVDDVLNFPISGTVPKESDLSSLLLPQPNDLALVNNTNKLYQYVGAEWNFYSHNLTKYKTANIENLQKVSTKITPMPMELINFSLQQMVGTFKRVDVVDQVIGCVSEMGMEGYALLGIDPYYLEQIFQWGRGTQANAMRLFGR